MLEEQNRSTSPVTVTQNVWSLAYQDALVLCDRAGERLFVQQDVNCNTPALVNTPGRCWKQHECVVYRRTLPHRVLAHEVGFATG